MVHRASLSLLLSGLGGRVHDGLSGEGGRSRFSSWFRGCGMAFVWFRCISEALGE